MASQRETAMVEEAFLHALKKKKHQDALTLLNRVTFFNFINRKDEATGKQCLHFAASEGFVEIVSKLLEHGAEVNSKDKNGDTSLHLATKGEHERVIALLIAFGANLDEKDKDKHSALYTAVQNKYPRIVDILLKFGKQPNLTEWEWDIRKKLNAKEEEIVNALGRQCSFLPGFDSGLIKSEVFYVKPNNKCYSESMHVELVTENITSSFVFQLYKMQSEYADKINLKKEQESFSDFYECRTWNCNQKELQLIVTVGGELSKGRKLKFISVDNRVGKVKLSNKTSNGSKEETVVTVNIEIKDCEYTKFTIATVPKSEKMNIPKEGVILKPKTAPGTEISIPQDAFEEDSKLSLNVIDTEETNIEEEKFLIATDAIAVHTSDGVQPQKDIDMKLPIHTELESNDVIVIGSNDDHPDSIDDWEIIEPSDDADVGSVSFKTNHFSMFVGVSKALAKTKEGLIEIHEALEKTIARKKRVVFLVFTKLAHENDNGNISKGVKNINPQNQGELSVVVHCSLSRKQQTVQDDWKEKGYQLVCTSEDKICTVSSVFQIAISGNVEEVYHSKIIELEFHLKRENYRVINVCRVEKEFEPEGQMEINQIEVTVKENMITVPSKVCLFCTEMTQVVKKVEDIVIKPLFNCKFSFIEQSTTPPPPPPPEPEPEPEKVDKSRERLRKAFQGFRLVYKAVQRKDG
ncbi:uncharacterized protein LOC127738681 isoform X2 [Mytilus californianus]|uniref:uncharacterized protein LOC127738681 isoform X2 n=1 Tax=Mytilus californianus TaxID=6549 RepID=UPI002246AC8B|nr:uncharacterized protein LOC127738681 isoform X2 [Mytilus californianus]